MLAVPVTLTRLIVKFAPVFSKCVWEHVQVLMVGALLAPGKRTVSPVLRVMGLRQDPRAHFSSADTAKTHLGNTQQQRFATKRSLRRQTTARWW